jgi:hypothetical protein
MDCQDCGQPFDRVSNHQYRCLSCSAAWRLGRHKRRRARILAARSYRRFHDASPAAIEHRFRVALSHAKSAGYHVDPWMQKFGAEEPCHFGTR